MSTVLFPPDPQYQGKGGQQPPAQQQQRGFFENLFAGFGIFQQTPPAYLQAKGGQQPPPSTGGGGSTTTPPTTGGGTSTTPPPPVMHADAVWSTEIGCPHMDGKTLTKRGKPVEVPLPSWATKYWAEFSPVYPGPDAAEAKPPDYDHPLSAFAFGLSEPARGSLYLESGASRPSTFVLTPHWIQASGNNSKADTIKAVLTVYFE